MFYLEDYKISEQQKHCHSKSILIHVPDHIGLIFGLFSILGFFCLLVCLLIAAPSEGS